jgi:hypothetical protein
MQRMANMRMQQMGTVSWVNELTTYSPETDSSVWVFFFIYLFIYIWVSLLPPGR